ncbi:ClpXP protease specificity-enhancing factor [Diaphorobacter sp.]|uniref:ClpXP protease specificity-enhancing factor n=1 Tax=Diaphorobacter sp. TaxID=1934310 RepID=UPI003D108048
MNAQDFPSTRPYLIRALYEWCSDNGFTPYVVVRVNESVRVPREYITNGEIVLNVSYDATSSLQIGNDFIEFKARFGGKPFDIIVPVGRVAAIYARENGQGMAFPMEEDDLHIPAPTQAGTPVAETERATVQLQSVDSTGGGAPDHEPPNPPPAAGGAGRPQLKRIK